MTCKFLRVIQDDKKDVLERCAIGADLFEDECPAWVPHRGAAS